ncbi:inorganic phosphate transporter [Halorussus lipolyticus]|uniref:inorganic phosphate transporter n=1 Tax=Halorussus lipolyticus TaxID=3034024 RepID=UPI0023E7DD9B|nr:inorganic phosphate transporter [Halorussus sp. DT80]
MVGTGVVTLVIAAIASLFMAWAIGAGSSGSTPYAPAVGANAISVMRAGFFVGLLGFLGAVMQGANVSEAVGKELIVGVELTAIAATTGLIVAALLVAIGVFTGYPIATAFTVTGAIVGVGLALGGDPAWAKYQQISALWVLTPFVGSSIAYTTAKLLRSERTAEENVIPLLGALVGLIIANVKFVLLGPPDVSQSVAEAAGEALALPAFAGFETGRIVVSLGIAVFIAGLLAWDVRRDLAGGQRHFLIALGSLVAFSAGGSQVGLAIGPLVPLLDPFEIPLVPVLVGGGIGLLAGSWTGAPRMIKALAQDYSALGPRRSIAALIPSFAIAQTAVFFGIPVSFNEIIVSAIVGSGYAAEGGGVSRKKMGYTVLAWLGSLVLATGIAYGVFTLIEIVG